MTVEMYAVWQCLYGIIMIALGIMMTLAFQAIRKVIKMEKNENNKI